MSVNTAILRLKSHECSSTTPRTTQIIVRLVLTCAVM